MSGKTVSARLDEQTAWELEFLKSSMGDKKATTDVLTEAIHFFYEFQSRKRQKKTAFDFLQETGFIGATAGDETGSIDYKKYVTKRVRKKL